MRLHPLACRGVLTGRDDKEVSHVEGLSVFDMIRTGWIATYPLILFSMVTLSIILERAWSLRNLVSKSLALAHQLCPPLEKGDFQTALQTTQAQASTPAGRIFTDVLS